MMSKLTSALAAGRARDAMLVGLVNLVLLLLILIFK